MTDELHKQTSYKLAEIWQFPVKGFPGQHYQSVTLQTDQLLPADRRYAVSNGHPASHKKLAEGWLSKRHFVQLLSEARLAGLSLKIDEESGRISLSDNTGVRADAPLDEAGPVMAQLQALLPDRFAEQPRLCRLAAGGYTDTDAPWITLAGSASLADFAHITHTAPDNRRFRLNLIVSTRTPFEEFDWIGKTISIGEAKLEIIEPVGRCAAIDVDPETTQREDDHLRTMRQVYGHTDLGVFGRVVSGGVISLGTKVQRDS